MWLVNLSVIERLRATPLLFSTQSFASGPIVNIRDPLILWLWGGRPYRHRLYLTARWPKPCLIWVDTCCMQSTLRSPRYSDHEMLRPIIFPESIPMHKYQNATPTTLNQRQHQTVI